MQHCVIVAILNTTIVKFSQRLQNQWELRITIIVICNFFPVYIYRYIYIYMIIQKISHNYKPLWQCTIHLQVFHDQHDSWWREKTLTMYQTRKSPSLFFRWASSKIHDSLMTVFTGSNNILHNFKVSQGAWNHPLKNHGFIHDATLFLCAHEHKTT